MKTRLATRAAEPINSPPSDFAAFVKSEIQQWSEVGRVANIQPAE